MSAAFSITRRGPIPACRQRIAMARPEKPAPTIRTSRVSGTEAVAGAVIGDVSEDALTPETQTYVLEHKTESVVLDGNVAVGTAIPETVQIQTIPDGQYGYVYVQDRPVLVDPQNRQIIHIYE